MQEVTLIKENNKIEKNIMKKIAIITLYLGILCNIGCTSKYGKNHPMFNTTGYFDKQLDENTFHLRYRSNALTSIEETKIYWNRRAKELCGNLAFESIQDEKMVREYYSMHNGFGDPYSYNYDFPEVVGIVKCLKIKEE